MLPLLAVQQKMKDPIPKVKELHKGRVLIFSFKDKNFDFVWFGAFSGLFKQLTYKKQLKKYNLIQGS